MLNLLRKGTLIKLPEELDGEAPKMKFKNYKNMLERPYYVCADIEATLSPYVDEKANEQEKHIANVIEEYAKQGISAKIRPPTRRIAKHKPIAVCLYLVCTFDSSKK